jgi:hypothetical protein
MKGYSIKFSKTNIYKVQESSVAETEPPSPGGPSLRAQLATSQIRNHIEFSKCDERLKILNPFFADLPLSTRTVKTRRKAVTLKTIQHGKYYHFGIKKAILETLVLLKFLKLPVSGIGCLLESMVFTSLTVPEVSFGQL